jgi:hypothetical protein
VQANFFASKWVPMNKTSLKKIIEHPDKDEIISKLIIGKSSKEIHEWLEAKYTNVSEAKFVIAEKSIKSFQDNYLDIYNLVKEDLVKTQIAINTSTEAQLELAVQNNPTYKSKMLELASEKIDVRKMVAHLCVVVETRFAQIFDQIQSDPQNINTRVDRMFKEYGELLGNLLDKYYKFTEQQPDQIVQHNVTLQVVDQHISVFHDVIKKVLSQMDLESSLYFMEVFNEEMEKLKMPSPDKEPSQEMRLADAKVLSETINKKINE